MDNAGFSSEFAKIVRKIFAQNFFRLRAILLARVSSNSSVPVTVYVAVTGHIVTSTCHQRDMSVTVKELFCLDLTDF